MSVQLHTLAQADPAPNVVLIFTDDQQFNALSANGNGIIQTPTMNTIATQGVRFTQARAALPVCSPSRAAILTGQFNQTNGVENLGQSINASSPRLGVQLQAAGYATGVTGKWHLGSGVNQVAAGFDYYATFSGNGSYYDRNYNVNGTTVNLPPESDPNSVHIDIYAADRSADFIDQSNAQNKPFFLWHNTQTPHVNGGLAWDALPVNHAKYDASDFYDPANGVDNLPGNWDDDLTNKPEYYENIRNRTLAQTDSRYLYGDPSELADHTSEYYAVITELDDMLTPLMTKLQTTPDPRNPGQNLIDNTYVIFMSDNGWLMGDHGMTSKSLPFDQASRVPMLVMGPGVDVGRVDDRQVSNIDIAPTILELAGASVPSAMQGQSIASLFSDGGTGPGVRDTNIVQIWESTFAGNKPILAGYDGRYEVFYTYDNESDPYPSYVEIYDTQTDPWELNNLAGDLRNNPDARAAWQTIQADIQTHRANDIGTFSHAIHNVGSGQTMTIGKSLPAPDGLADQTIPRVIAANVVAQSGGTVEGEGVILGDMIVQDGGTLKIGPAPTIPGFVKADFNDLTLNDNLNGQSGGEGWSGTWTSEDSSTGGTIAVRNGDLAPHASTGYVVPQDPAAAHHVERNSAGASTDRRDLQETLTGDVWFSFLARVDGDGRAGINIDGHGNFSDNRFLLRAESSGTALDFFVQGSPSNLTDFIPVNTGLTDTQLILGKLSVAAGNDTLEWWVNPDVTLGQAGLTGSADAHYILNDRDFDEDDGTPGIQKWSVHVYSGGELDNLVISNGSNAYFDVTGFDDGTGTPALPLLTSGTLIVDGDFSQALGGTMVFDLLGPSDYDRLIVGGAFSAGGILDVTLAADAPALQLGDVFDLLDFGSASGAFDTLSLPTLGPGLLWNTSDLLTTGELRIIAELAGDLDGDGFVGIDDLNLVLSHWNQAVPPGNPLADPSGDGFVGIDDLNTVLGNWNAGTPPNSNANIPEPGSMLLLMICSVSAFSGRRR